MTGWNYLFYICVFLWTLAIGIIANAYAEDGEKIGFAEKSLAEGDQENPESPAENSCEKDIAAGEPPHLYAVPETPSITLTVWYLRRGGDKCTRRRLRLTIVGAKGNETPVTAILSKLYGLFDVRLKYGPQWMLFMSKSSSWESLETPPLFLRYQPSGFTPIDTKTLVKDLKTDSVFVGRLGHGKRFRFQTSLPALCAAVQHGKKLCETLNLDDSPLMTLPLSGVPGLPTVFMQADPLRPHKPGSAGYPSFGFTHTFSLQELLEKLLPETARFCGGPAADLTSKDGLTAAERGLVDGEISDPAKSSKLDATGIYIHTQSQLDLLFPSRTYYAIHLLDTLTGEMTAETQSSFSTSAATDFVCSSTRFMRLHPASWKLVTGPNQPPRRQPSGRQYTLLARLLAARAPQDSYEQQPQVVLLKLYKESERGREHWKEELLVWEEMEHPASHQDYHLYADPNYGSRFPLPFTSPSRPAVSRLNASKMIKQYNIQKEELYSMWEKDPKHSAVDPTTAQGVFTRPLNTAVLRQASALSPLVSPVDGVLQHSFFSVLDQDSDIGNLTLPHVKGVSFNLYQLVFGGPEPLFFRMDTQENRVHVLIYDLTARDYHHVHSPADWEITHKTYIPGCVKKASDGGNLSQLERVSLVGHWDPDGQQKKLFFSVTLISGTFVGGIQLAWENQSIASKPVKPDCDKVPDAVSETLDRPMCIGQEMAGFQSGSTVAVIFEAPPDFNVTAGPCSGVRVGVGQGVRGRGIRPKLWRCSAFPFSHLYPSDYLDWLRHNRESAGKILMENSLLPSSWRASALTTATELMRSLERGLMNANALAQHLYFYSALDRKSWQVAFVGQPITLVKSGGMDSSTDLQLPLCYPSPDQKQIRLKFQGRVSSLVLYLSTTGRERLLFSPPYFGCDGDSNAGVSVAGVQANWRVGDRGDLTVDLRLISGNASDEGCVQLYGAGTLRSTITVKARCGIDWGTLLPGSSAMKCDISDIERATTGLQVFDVETQDFVCQH